MKRCIYLLIFLILIQGGKKLFAQTDTEFWFAVPKITEGHPSNAPNNPNNWRYFFRFANLDLENQITISLPADPTFEPIEATMAPFEALTINVTDLIWQIWNNNPDQIYNRGIQITATNLTTAYFEVGNHFNPDIFSLKGRNALGTDFFVPFQNYFRNGNYNPQPYSGIYIVATQDNTEITVTPTRPVFPGRPAGVPFTLTLHRGQSIAVVPDDYATTGQWAENHLGGTRVESNYPIAITTSDDSVDASGTHGGCKDLIGDQLIPTNIIGRQYITMRGKLGQGPNANTHSMPEFFYVLATEPNTLVEIDGALEAVLQPGEQFRWQFNKQTYFIETSNPSYVYHVAGFGCEMAGAVLPPIDVCTGSTKVSFTRSKGESFFLNILVRAGAEDGFTVAGQGPNTVIQASDFEVIPGTTDWLAAEFEFSANAPVPAGIPVGEATLIENTKNVFHLGVINGGPTSGTMYGYFSDFNSIGVQASISGGDTIFQSCSGDPIQLIASGGTSYVWHPVDFLSDPTIRNPIALPQESIKYTVTVSGACNMVDSASVFIEVGEPPIADFSVNATEGCSPFVLELTNNSIGASTFQWHMGNGTILEDTDVSYVYINQTTEPVVYEVSLISTSDISCVDTAKVHITVFPEVYTELSADTLFGCNPLDVTFQHQTTGANEYHWDFGDGTISNSAQSEITHSFVNNTSETITYTVSFSASSEYGCSVSETLNIQVLPDVVADFTFEYLTSNTVIFFNQSQGGTTFLWDFGDGNTSASAENEVIHAFENPTNEDITYTVSLITENNFGCIDNIDKDVLIFPEEPETFEVVFNLDMSGLNGFNGDEHNLYITGSMLDWVTPGFDPDNQLMINITDSEIWTISMVLEPGEYEYKYFRETGSQSGEWESIENRIVLVDGETVINDIWQQQTNIPYTGKSNKVIIYPNPGRDIVKLESSNLIQSISLYTLTGKTMIHKQEVMSHNFELDFRRFESGLYVICFFFDFGVEAQMLTIIK